MEYTRAQIRTALLTTLKALRRRAGISQEALALASGVDRSYVGEIERGLRSPTIETLCRLLRPLDASLESFGRQFDKNLRRARR